VDAIRKHTEFTVAFCVRHSNLWQSNTTVCNSMLDVVHKDYERVQETRELVSQLIRRERHIQTEEGYFYAHSLFGMLDSDSEAFYNHKISQLEEDLLDWLKLMREQTTVVRSTLKSVNQTLHDVSATELVLTSELHKILNFINIGNRKIENKYALTALLLTQNDHAMRIQQAIGEVRDVYNTIIHVCSHWRN